MLTLVREYSYYTTEVYVPIDFTKDAYTESKGEWTLVYKSYPAQKAGEYTSATKSAGYSHACEAGLGFDIKGVQYQLGYTFCTHEDFSVGINSAPLEKGEVVTAYIKNQYSVTAISERKYERTYKQGTLIKEKPLNLYRYSSRAYRAIPPLIKLVYSIPTRGNDCITKEEYYTSDKNGHCKLVEKKDYKE